MYIYQKKIWHLNSAFKSTTVQQQSESLSSIKKVITLWNWRCSFNYDIANELREKTVWLTSISTFKSKQAPVNTGWLSQWIIVFSCFSSLSPFSLPLLPSFLSLIQMGVGGMSNITLALKSAVYFICILLLELSAWSVLFYKTLYSTSTDKAFYSTSYPEQDLISFSIFLLYSTKTYF